MKNREIYRILREHIDPVALDLGFAAQKNTGTDLPWTRKLNSKRYEIIWCQIDKWPWDVWLGTQFTVNFQNSRASRIGPSRGTKMARIGDLLKGNFKKEAEAIQNRAIEKIRVPTAKEYNDEMGAEFADSDDAFILEMYREKSQPAKFGKKLGDLWLRIVNADDARAWAQFLAVWLPAGLKCFDTLEGDQYVW